MKTSATILALLGVGQAINPKTPTKLIQNSQRPQSLTTLKSKDPSFDVPVIEFVNSWDIIGYRDSETDILKDKIHLKKTKEVAGDVRYCHMGDLAKIHYVSRNGDGEQIQNSKETRLGNQVQFRVGYYEVSKCWDVAIMQMKSGEKATIDCPAIHDTARGTNTGQYNNIGHKEDDTLSSHDRTSGTADVSYEIDIIECGGADFAPLPAKDVHDGQCMNIVSAWIKQHDQNLALMPSSTNTEFNLAIWNKTDVHQKWQWNTSDQSLHTWIDWSAFEPAIKFGNSYCGNQSSIDHKEDNLNSKEKKWHTVDSCNKLCHSKTWCTEFTIWKQDNKGHCRLYGSECTRSANDTKWDHYSRSTARPLTTAITCPAETAHFIEDRNQAITWEEARDWVASQPNGRLPTAAEVQHIIAKNSGQSEYLDAAFRVPPLAYTGNIHGNQNSCNEGVFGSKGVDYRGCQNKTKSGKTCMDWGSHNPHAHPNLTDTTHPDSGISGHNHCRNPDGSDTIWCYTTDAAHRWELCDPIDVVGSWTPTLEHNGSRSYVSIGPLHGPPIEEVAHAGPQPMLLHENHYLASQHIAHRIPAAEGGQLAASSVSACNIACNNHVDCIAFGIGKSNRSDQDDHLSKCDLFSTLDGFLPTLKDTSSSCSQWAIDGECSWNPGWMLTGCAKSCNCAIPVATIQDATWNCAARPNSDCANPSVKQHCWAKCKATQPDGDAVSSTCINDGVVHDSDIYKPSKNNVPNPSRAEQAVVNAATVSGPCTCTDHPANLIGNHSTKVQTECIDACFHDARCMSANFDKTLGSCLKYSKVCQCDQSHATQNQLIMDYAPAVIAAPGKWYPGVDLVHTIGNMPAWGTDKNDTGNWHTAVLWMKDCIPRGAYTPPAPIKYTVTYNKGNKHFTNASTGLSIMADIDKNEATKAHLKKSPHDMDKQSRWDTVACEN